MKRDGLGLKFDPPTARPPLTHTLCARNKRGDDNMKLKVIIFTQLKKGDIGLRFPLSLAVVLPKERHLMSF